MDVLSFTETRARFEDVVEGVVRGGEPVMVSRRRGGDVVICSREEWERRQEMVRLSASSAEPALAAAAQPDGGDAHQTRGS